MHDLSIKTRFNDLFSYTFLERERVVISERERMRSTRCVPKIESRKRQQDHLSLSLSKSSRREDMRYFYHIKNIIFTNKFLDI